MTRYYGANATGSRDLGLSYKTVFVLCHKMREAMAEEMRGRTLISNNG